MTLSPLLLAAGILAILLAGVLIGLEIAQFAHDAANYGHHSTAAAPLPVAMAIAQANEPPEITDNDSPAPRFKNVGADSTEHAFHTAWHSPELPVTTDARSELLHRVIAGLKALDPPTDPIPQVYPQLLTPAARAAR